jgi:chromosomal replication initiation ATPase DnaA
MSEEHIQELKSLRNHLTSRSTMQAQLIMDAVCLAFGISVKELTGKGKTRSLVDARMVCAYLLRVKLKYHLRDVGQMLGRRDHSTVCNLIDRMDVVVFQHDPVVKVFQGIEKIVDQEIAKEAA